MFVEHHSVSDQFALSQWSLGMRYSFSIIQYEIGDDIVYIVCVYVLLECFILLRSKYGWVLTYIVPWLHILIHFYCSRALSKQLCRIYIYTGSRTRPILFILFMSCPSCLAEKVALRFYASTLYRLGTRGEGVSVLYLNNDDIYLLNEGC